MKVSDLDKMKYPSQALKGPYPVTIRGYEVVQTDDGKKYIILDCGKSSIKMTLRKVQQAVSDGMPDELEEWIGRNVTITSETDKFKNWFWRVHPQ